MNSIWQKLNEQKEAKVRKKERKKDDGQMGSPAVSVPVVNVYLDCPASRGGGERRGRRRRRGKQNISWRTNQTNFHTFRTDRNQWIFVRKKLHCIQKNNKILPEKNMFSRSSSLISGFYLSSERFSKLNSLKFKPTPLNQATLFSRPVLLNTLRNGVKICG